MGSPNSVTFQCRILLEESLLHTFVMHGKPKACSTYLVPDMHAAVKRYLGELLVSRDGSQCLDTPSCGSSIREDVQLTVQEPASLAEPVQEVGMLFLSHVAHSSQALTVWVR